MQTLALGRTGLTVSAVGFGGIPIQRRSETDAVAVVRRCLNLGVTFLDTAHGYTTSEERIGQAIAGRREGLVIATKSPAHDGASFDAHLALSLKRLGVEQIDILQFHGVSSAETLAQIVAPGGPLEHARTAKVAGVIGHIGVTTHALDLAPELITCGHFETLMIPFNIVSTEPEALIPLCRAHGVGLIAMKPMGGGAFTNPRPALNYLRQFSGVLPLVGIENTREIEEIAALMESSAALTVADLDEIAAMRAEYGGRYCRRCDYCQPCPNEIAISTMLTMRGFSRRLSAERTFGPSGQEAINKARACAECGACESRCPYHLPIRDLLKEAIAWFDAAAPAAQRD